jgi:YD repeat-containing protein
VDKATAKGKYLTTVWVHTPNYSGTSNVAVFGVRVLDDNDNILTGYGSSINVSSSAGEWTKIELVFEVTDDMIHANTTDYFQFIPRMFTSSVCEVYVDDFRFHPIDAKMTSYTYKPLVGVTSVSDENGKPTHYEYDDYGRLETIRDHNDNIIEQHEYNYADPN